MFSSSANMKSILGDFRIQGMMLRYSSFVPRLYNFCKSLGFTPGKIMPSRAFCSDESQGYPIILIAKHFGTFPFNHGMVGGVVATDRHAPHAEHGKDMVIIQASHVGYDPDTRTFGTYRRLQTEHNESSASCGKIDHVIAWYQNEYAFARENIFLERSAEGFLITVDNMLLNPTRANGLFLNLERMAARGEDGEFQPLRSLSTAKIYRASDAFTAMLGPEAWPEGGRQPIGARLAPEFFRFKREIDGDAEGRSHLERNLLDPMAWIVTSAAPLLTAAQANTQVEYDRTFRTIVKERGYRKKRVVYVAGLNIDISPPPGQLFPLTKFVPWAAYIQDEHGGHRTLEQAELVAELNRHSTDNPDQIDLDDAIRQMGAAQEVKIHL